MDSQWVDIIVRVISQLGFPIFVAVWMILKTDRLLMEVRDVLTRLLEAIERKVQ